VNVLSLFDGMSCGRIALDRAGIPVTNYFSSEIDKYVIEVSNDNYPDIVRLGDINDWHFWGIDPSKIDLILAGSPCQGFSFAGKQLAFDDPRSVLFFKFVDILNWVKSHNPNVKFLLENVKMKKDHLAVITDRVGVEPVLINSALVSAQNRQRYYWCNWNIEQPEDKGVLLGDIIDDRCQEPNGDGWHKWWKDKKDFQIKKRYSSVVNDGSTDKAICMTARQYASWNGNFVILQKPRGFNIGGVKAKKGKTPTLSSCSWEHNNFLGKDDKYRNLTPLECERLQTVPDNYTKAVSNSQRYKMLGNGWTVDVIAHILKQGINR
jgi:DNA-cytosine methyltransferase